MFDNNQRVEMFLIYLWNRNQIKYLKIVSATNHNFIELVVTIIRYRLLMTDHVIGRLIRLIDPA